MNSQSHAVPGGVPYLEFLDATHVRVGRRNLIYFGGSNYLGLAQHPRVLESMHAPISNGSVQPGASRATTGEHPLYVQVEKDLARFFQQPAAALMPCGYLAPIAALQALRSRITHILLDDDAHACVKDASRVAGLPLETFSHRSGKQLASRIHALGSAARPAVLTDGTFGTRGGMAPVDEYLNLLPRTGWLLVDDAHGAGTVGPGGRGVLQHFGLKDPRMILSISLAKAFGVGGGAVLGSAPFIRELRQHAAAFIGTTSMPLPVVAGIRSAVNVIGNEPSRVQRLQQNMSLLHKLVPRHPLLSNHPATPVTAVLPSAIGEIKRLRSSLERQGIFPSLIRYMGSPAHGFFRLAVGSEHTRQDLERLAHALHDGLDGFRGSPDEAQRWEPRSRSWMRRR